MMGGDKVFEVNIDSGKLREIVLEKVEEHLKEIEGESIFFLNSEQLQKYLNMSWNSITAHLISDDKFPSLRLGRKWLFPKKEVDLYMENYYVLVSSNGGDILRYKRKERKR